MYDTHCTGMHISYMAFSFPLILLKHVSLDRGEKTANQGRGLLPSTVQLNGSPTAEPTGSSTTAVRLAGPRSLPTRVSTSPATQPEAAQPDTPVTVGAGRGQSVTLGPGLALSPPA